MDIQYYYLQYENNQSELNKNQKYKLIDVLNNKVEIEHKDQYVSNAIPIYMQSVFEALESEKESKILNYELQIYEDISIF